MEKLIGIYFDDWFNLDFGCMDMLRLFGREVLILLKINFLSFFSHQFESDDDQNT